MIQEIKESAQSVGITAIVSNSSEKIETQLNRITGKEELPAMLVSWDYDTTINIDEHGFLESPNTQIVLLLMTKAPSLKKEDMEQASEEMGVYFMSFIKDLNEKLKVQLKGDGNALFDISYKNVPSHGMGKHSGVLGRFTMKTKAFEITDCK